MRGAGNDNVPEEDRGARRWRQRRVDRADLTKAGLDVMLIDQWPEHVQAMRERGQHRDAGRDAAGAGARVQSVRRLHVHRAQFDIVLLLMKAYDTRWACQLIEPYLKPDGLVAGVQNGMTDDIIAEVVGPERTMGCVIEISSMMFDPGIVTRHSPPPRSWFAVGSIDRRPAAGRTRSPTCCDIPAASRSSTISAPAKWMKLVSNATTLVTTAILGMPMLEAAKIPAMRELMLRSGQEALDTGAAIGHPVLPIFGLKPEDVRQTNRLVETLLDTLLTGFVLPNTKTTVLAGLDEGPPQRGRRPQRPCGEGGGPARHFNASECSRGRACAPN